MNSRNVSHRPLVMRIIGAVALAHLINDLIQSVLPSIYPWNEIGT